MDRWSRWVEARLTVAVRLLPAGHPDGEASVWRVVDAAHEHALAYLKLHRIADKWRRERAILERLAEPPAAPVPELLAAHDEGRALLLRACPGRLASSGSPSPDEQRALHEQAGRLRRRLDAVPIDAREDPLPVPAALARRLAGWIERARPWHTAARLRRLEAAFEPGVFEGSARRWSHRDLAPHNWIVEPTREGPRLSVIDFGQARPDVWLVDALKLWDGPWAAEPTLADAFWAGYGRHPSALEQRQLHQLALLHGLATATWGDHHGHATFSSHGRAVLDRALAAVEGGS